MSDIHGNSVATGFNAATMAPGQVPATPCEELEEKNKSLRQSLARDRKSPSIRGTFSKKGASTVAHASLNGGPPVGAGSRLLPTRYSKRVVKGLWNGKHKTKIKQRKSNLCPEPPYKYDKGYRPHQSHCESKILETLFAATPKPTGTLLLNINWQSKGNPNDKNPCPACKDLLTHAQEECGLTIMLCGKDPKTPPKKFKPV